MPRRLTATRIDMRLARSLHCFAVAEGIDFHVPFQGTVDFDEAIIRDVAVIIGDIEAEGHDLIVDGTTVKQLHALAKKKVPVNLDHGSGIKDTCGFLTNFRIDENKLRADWHLLRSHDETPKMRPSAQRFDRRGDDRQEVHAQVRARRADQLRYHETGQGLDRRQPPMGLGGRLFLVREHRGGPPEAGGAGRTFVLDELTGGELYVTESYRDESIRSDRLRVRQDDDTNVVNENSGILLKVADLS
jgi:hypothetical protein